MPHVYKLTENNTVAQMKALELNCEHGTDEKCSHKWHKMACICCNFSVWRLLLLLPILVAVVLKAKL